MIKKFNVLWMNEINPELANLLIDEVLLEYQRQRMKEMFAKQRCTVNSRGTNKEANIIFINLI